MKKKIYMLILILLGYKNVYAITSSEVTYNNDTIKNTIDTLLPELNMCKTSGTANANQILKNKTAYVNGSLVTGNIESISARTITPGTSRQTISKKYLSGNQTIEGDSNLKSENIACGKTIFGITGTHGCNAVCKRATKLHQTTCNSSLSYGCRKAGYSYGDTITYGSLGDSGTLTPGDAFDCDVNGDGVYDEVTERFYYVSDYYDTSTKTFDNTYATLIYYNDVSGGSPNETATYQYYSSSNNTYGPTIAVKQLPTTTQWSNVSLKNETRNTRDNNGDIVKSNFSYSGYAARLLTDQELKKGCSNASTSTGSLDSCAYLMENTQYDNSSYVYYYWLETPYSGNSGLVWDVYGYDRRVYYNGASNSIGVRPAIDVLKSDISY